MAVKTLTNPVTWASFTDAAVDSYVALDREPFIDRRAGATIMRLGDGVTPGGRPAFNNPIGTIAKPTILSPLNGTVNTVINPVFTGSIFNGLDKDGNKAVHGASYWEIATDSAFVNKVYSSGNTRVNLTTLDLGSENIALAFDTVHYIRVQYVTANGAPSEWSPVSSFTVKPDYAIVKSDKMIARIPNADSYMGSPVKISADGNVIVTGSYHRGADNHGSAHIFRRDPVNNTWSQAQLLEAVTQDVDDYFGLGLSISASGKTICVSAPGRDEAGLLNVGRLHIYTYSAVTDQWELQQEIIADIPVQYEALGRLWHDMSLDGNVVYAGAHSGGPGAVYIFTRDVITGVWSQSQRITASDGVSGDRLGFNVLVNDANTLMLVGAYLASVNGGVANGKAYIFANVAGVWTEQQIILPPDVIDDYKFSGFIGMSASGNTIAISSAETNGAYIDKTYLFNFDAVTGNYVYDQSIIGSLASVGSSTGTAMTFKDDDLLYLGDLSAKSYYVFKRIGLVWTEVDVVTVSESFGVGGYIDIATDTGELAVSAYRDSTYSPSHGAVYIFR